jgi:hypothetical protein
MRITFASRRPCWSALAASLIYGALPTSSRGEVRSEPISHVRCYCPEDCHDGALTCPGCDWIAVIYQGPGAMMPRP